MKVAVIIFVILGLTALVGALFAGAWWHYFTAVICGIMTLACIAEIKRNKK